MLAGGCQYFVSGGDTIAEEARASLGRDPCASVECVQGLGHDMEWGAVVISRL